MPCLLSRAISVAVFGTALRSDVAVFMASITLLESAWFVIERSHGESLSTPVNPSWMTQFA